MRALAIALSGCLMMVPALGLAGGGLRPPADVPMAANGNNVLLVQANTAELVQRLQRVEAQNRELTGQVEELQNRIRRTEEAFKRYQEDMEFRLQALEGGNSLPKKKTETKPAIAPKDETAAADTRLGEPPKSLGTLPAEPEPMLIEPGDKVPGDPSAPLDLTQQGQAENDTASAEGNSTLTPPGLPKLVTPDPAQGAVESAAKAEFDIAYGMLQRRDFEAAEISFRQWLDAHPDDELAADATHWLGESYFQRQQYRDAAEKFLKVTTDFSQSRRAPSSMLRLGMSLAALGEKDAACATYREIGKKYPQASNTVKSATKRESDRAKCTV